MINSREQISVKKLSIRHILAFFIITIMIFSPLYLSNVTSHTGENQSAQLIKDAVSTPKQSLNSKESRTPTPVEDSSQTPIPTSDIPQESVRPVVQLTEEEQPYITTGTITVLAKTPEGTLTLPMEVVEILPDNTEKVVLTTTTAEKSVDLPTGVYKIRVLGDTEITSDPIVLQEGKTELFEPLFSKVNIRPYSFSPLADQVLVELVDAEQHSVWGPKLVKVDDVQTLLLTPGVYTLQSPDKSTRTQNIDASIDADIAVLALKRADPRGLGLDGTVAFGDLAINVTTADSMPLSGVSVRVYDNTTSPTSCTGGTAVASTNTTGLWTFTLAPGNYKVCSYKSFSAASVWNSSVTVTGGSLTVVDVSFSRINVYASNNDYVTVSNSTYTFGSSWTGGDFMLTYYVIPGTYNVAFSTDPDVSGIVVGYRDAVSVGLTFNNAPTIQSVVSSPRINANGTATVDIEVKDLDFDPLSFYTGVNVGSSFIGTPHWIRDSVYGVRINYTAPAVDGFYQMDIGVQDTSNLYDNYTVYLSARSSSVTIKSREAGYAPINTYTSVYEYQTNSYVTGQWTGADGNATFSISDGRYYYTLSQANIYTSPVYKFDGSTYSWQYNWSRITVNTTAEWDNPTATNVYLYNGSDLVSYQSSTTTSGSTGLASFIAMPYSNYSIRATRTTSIWKNGIVAPEASEVTLSFSFGGLAVYTFTGTTPESRYVTLYNDTTGSTIIGTWTGGDGYIYFQLAPFDNYSLYDSGANVWYKAINITAGKAIYVGNFTDSAPVISSIDTNPSGTRITASQSVNITVVASDVDPFDKLTYNWTANVGSISGSGSTITYTSPATLQSYKISVTVSDQFGGSASTFIYVSDRSSTVSANVIRGGGGNINSYVNIYRARDNAPIFSSWTGSDGYLATTLQDGEYSISVSQSSTTISYDFIADAGNYSFDFQFADFIFNSTSYGNTGISSSIQILDPVSRASITSTSTSSATGLSINIVIKPGVYDLKVYSSSGNAFFWVDNVSISAQEIKTVDLLFSEIIVNLNTAYGNPLNSYVTSYNGTSGATILANWIGSDGTTTYYYPAGNYSFSVNSYPTLNYYNNILGTHDRITLDVNLGTIVLYSNNGTDPYVANAYVYYQGTTTLIRSTNTGADGVQTLDLAPGTYDVRIDATYYYNVTILAGQATYVGNRLDSAPVIVSVQSTDMGPSSTQSIVVEVSDLDYDYGTLSLTATANVGTTGNTTMAFSNQNVFHITFDYSSPATDGFYAINITVSDGELDDTYYLIVSQQTNVINLHAIRGDAQPYSTSIYIYDHQSGNTIQSLGTGSDGNVTYNLVDGWYDIRFIATTEIWFYSVFVRDHQVLDLTATFGDLNVYSTGVNGVPLNSYVILRYIDGTYITGQWTGGDGQITWVLAPGEYNVEVQESTSIFFNVTILGGRQAFLGTDIPQLSSPPPDIVYQYGATGHSISWDFTDTTPNYYMVSSAGTIYANGSWDGSTITVNVDGLEVGDHLFRAFVNDSNGLINVDFVLVTVTAPPGPYANGLTPLNVAFGDTLLYSWNVSAILPDKYVIYLNSTEVDTGSWSNGTISYDLGVQSPGTYNLTLSLNDTLGRVFVHTAIITYLQDPVPTFDTMPQAISFGTWESGSISWSATDNNPTTYQVLRNGTVVESGSYASGESKTYSISGLEQGMYNFTVVVFDGSGSSNSATAIVTVNADTTAPAVNSPSDISVYDYETGSFTWTFSDVQNGNYTVSDNGTVLDTGSFSQTGSVLVDYSNFSIGVHNLVITLFDNSGNSVTDTVVVTIIADTTAPAVNSPPDISVYDNETGAFTWTFSDAQDGDYTVSDNGTVLYTGSFSHTGSVLVDYTNFSIGVHNLVIMLFDNSGNSANDTVVVTIMEVPVIVTLPEFTSVPNDLVTGIENITLTWTFDSWETGSYTIKLNGTTVDSGSWTNDPHSITFSYSLPDSGAYTVELILSGNGMSISDSVVVTYLGGGSTSSASAPLSGIYTLFAIIAAGVFIRRRRKL